MITKYVYRYTNAELAADPKRSPDAVIYVGQAASGAWQSIDGDGTTTTHASECLACCHARATLGL